MSNTLCQQICRFKILNYIFIFLVMTFILATWFCIVWKKTSIIFVHCIKVPLPVLILLYRHILSFFRGKINWQVVTCSLSLRLKYLSSVHGSVWETGDQVIASFAFQQRAQPGVRRSVSTFTGNKMASRKLQSRRKQLLGGQKPRLKC